MLIATVVASSLAATITGAEAPASVKERIWTGEYRAAEILARQALQNAAGDALREATAADSLVAVLRKLGKANVPETRELAERSLRLREERLGPDAFETAISLRGYGGLLVELSTPAEAIEPLERAHAISQRHFGPDGLPTASFELELGIALHAAGKNEEASSALLHAGSIYEAGEPELTELQRLERLRLLQCEASIHLARGEFPAAEEAAKQCLAGRERLLGQDHPDLVFTLNVLGIIERRLQRFPEARAYYERALAIADAKLPPEHVMRAQILSNLAGVLWSWGSSRDALPYAVRAYELRRETLPADHPDLTQSIHNLGVLYADLGDNDRALRYLQRAITGYEASLGPDHPRLWVLLWKTAEILGNAGRVEEALALSQRALDIGQKADLAESADYATNLEVHANLLRILGRCEEGLPLMERSVELSKAGYGAEHPEVGRGESALATLLAAMGDPAAGPLAQHADELGRQFLRLSARGLSEDETFEFARVRPSGFDLLLSIAVAPAPTESERAANRTRAWDCCVRSRALVLDETVRRNRANLGFDQTSPELRAAHAARIDASRELANLLVRGPDERGGDAHSAAVEGARTKLQEGERNLRALSRAVRAEAADEDAGIDEVVASLPKGAALVAFARYTPWAVGTCEQEAEGPRYAAFVMPSKDAQPVLVPLGSADEIDAMVMRWRDAVGHAPLPGMENESRDAGTALAARVWAPLEPLCRGAERVYLVPEGTLNLVNFDALPTSEGRYLVEAGPILTLLSAERDLVRLAHPEEREARAHGLLAFGDPDFDHRSDLVSNEAGNGGTNAMLALHQPFRGETSPCLDLSRIRWSRLPATMTEVENAARIWKAGHGTGHEKASADARILIGVEATEGALKRLAPGCETLHIATHGFFLDGHCAEGGGSTRGLGGLVAGAGTVVTDPANESATSERLADEETSERDPAAPEHASKEESSTPPEVEDAWARPLRLSGLVLAGANKRNELEGAGQEDGILTAEEIATLDLSGMRCVILSACDTGVGEIHQSEGILGLRRAFRAAGARDIVMSMWAVDDESSRVWMDAWYRAMVDHDDDATLAVRAASLQTLTDRRARGLPTEPFYWAAFVAVVGS